MLTAIPLPDRPLSVLWQSTVIDIEPGSRYGYSHDAAAINTTLAVVNDTGADMEFPLILATTDPEERDPSHVAVRVGGEQPTLATVEVDPEWETLRTAIVQAATSQGHDQARIEGYVAELRKDVGRAYKSEIIRLPNGQERFIRSYQRKLLSERDGMFEFRGLFPLPQFLLARGGTISVTAMLPRATNRFAVDLVDWTRNYSPQAFGKDGLPAVAGRFALAWFWQNDPELFVAYRYA
jgi:hypothetical protein